MRIAILFWLVILGESFAGGRRGIRDLGTAVIHICRCSGQPLGSLRARWERLTIEASFAVLLSIPNPASDSGEAPR